MPGGRWGVRFALVLAMLTVAAGTNLLLAVPWEPRVAAAVKGPCDTQDLEPRAMAGKLTDEERACLEARRDAEPAISVRDAISRLLMADAWARRDTKGWTLLARYHLEHIDDEDPTLAYKYALRCAIAGPGKSEEAIYWASRALSLPSRWDDEERTSKEYSLHKIRAVAARELWETAPDEPTRLRVAMYAADWAVYAASVGKDVDQPKQLCLAVGSTDPRCQLP